MNTKFALTLVALALGVANYCEAETVRAPGVVKLTCLAYTVPFAKSLLDRVRTQLLEMGAISASVSVRARERGARQRLEQVPSKEVSIGAATKNDMDRKVKLPITAGNIQASSVTPTCTQQVDFFITMHAVFMVNNERRTYVGEQLLTNVQFPGQLR